MTKNLFSGAKTSKSVMQINVATRAVHSGRDALKSGFKGFKQGFSKGTNPRGVADNVEMVGGIAANVMDKATVACTIATAAGNAAAATFFLATPACGIGMAAAGLILAAKAAYSNRDSAHRALVPYVWSYIDDEPPKAIDKTAAAAAMRLILEGQSQLDLAQSKLNQAHKNYDTWLKTFNKYSRPLATLEKMRPMPTKQSIKNQRLQAGVWQEVLKNEKDRVSHWNKGVSSNGPLNYYLRRLVHYGNYMQAFQICGKAFQEDYTRLDDFAEKVTDVKQTRDALKELSDKVQKQNKFIKNLA